MEGWRFERSVANALYYFSLFIDYRCSISRGIIISFNGKGLFSDGGSRVIAHKSDAFMYRNGVPPFLQ